MSDRSEAPETPSQQVVLIIDDDTRNLSILSEYLSRSDLSILVAEDGESGVERARYTHPDLILLDVILPGMDGFSSCRNLKADAGTADIPVIFMTALDETEFKVKGFEAGGVDYVTKPFNREEVRARVGVHLKIAELTRRLRIANDDLERRVEARTSELARLNLALRAEVEERRNAEESLKRLLAEKQELIKEIHHRVKNNLQVINSILNLGSDYISDSSALRQFRRCQGRILSIALVHEGLHHASDLTNIDFRDYVNELLSELSQSEASSAGIAFENEVENLRLTIESAVPCGLALYEFVTNAIAHAFPEGWAGERRVTISMERRQGAFALVVSDTGVGLPAGFDIATMASLGLKLASAALDQLHGAISFAPGSGASFRMDVPEIVRTDDEKGHGFEASICR